MQLFIVKKAKKKKKIPYIPQIFNDNKFIVRIFDIFAKQFLMLDNGNALPLHFSLLTGKAFEWLLLTR